MGAGHNHDHAGHGQPRSRLVLVLLLTSAFMCIEALAGWITGSLALWADAGHMLADVAALSLSTFAMWMATKQSTPDKWVSPCGDTGRCLQCRGAAFIGLLDFV